MQGIVTSQIGITDNLQTMLVITKYKNINNIYIMSLHISIN